MAKVRYSKDVDALLIELSGEDIDHAEEAGQFIVHFSRTSAPVLLEIQSARDFLLGSLSSVINEQETTLP
jgi:hypothetical protein